MAQTKRVQHCLLFFLYVFLFSTALKRVDVRDSRASTNLCYEALQYLREMPFISFVADGDVLMPLFSASASEQAGGKVETGTVLALV